MSALLALTHQSGFAASPFQHEDWELVCDNTRTCYAAGYALDSDKIPATMLVKRAAGAGARVEIEIRHNNIEESAKPGNTIDLRIGKVGMRQVPLAAGLSAAQVAQLLPLLAEGDAIHVAQGQIKSRISLSGAKAVLTKMDELQGRVGTPSALVAKGTSGKAPLAPISVPVIQAARISADSKVDAALKQAVLAVVKRNDCTATGDITLTRLNPTHLLAEQSPCWTGARNSGNGYWVVEQLPPHRAFKVEDETLNEFDAKTSTLSGIQLSGVGCVFVSQWVWDGKSFVKATTSSSGMCRTPVSDGWQLPTYKSRVLPAR